jgi:ABC-type dipeptide/oligopeptide/nickel transport system permease subunit
LTRESIFNMNKRTNVRFVIFGVLVLVFAAGPWLVPYNPAEQWREIANTAPSTLHWLGADDYGRDILSRFLAGGSWSILSGISATALVLILGWSAGGLAGFRPGWPDHIIMRLAELMLSLPWLYVLIGLRAVLPLSTKPRTAVALMLLVIALVSWARPARLVRGLVLSLSQRGYVEAARGFGVPGWRIFFATSCLEPWACWALRLWCFSPDSFSPKSLFLISAWVSGNRNRVGVR